MKENLKRFWGLYCSLILVVTIICGGITGIFAWNYFGRDASEGQTIPPSTEGTTIVIDTSGIASSERVDDGQSGSLIRLSEGQAHPQAVEQLPVVTGEPLTMKKFSASWTVCLILKLILATR